MSRCARFARRAAPRSSPLLLPQAARGRRADPAASTATSQIQPDGSLDVTETIDVRAENDRDQPRHLPRFPDPLPRPRRAAGAGRLHASATSARRAAGAGKRSRPITNGVRIRIGDADRIVDAGRAPLRHPLPRPRGRSAASRTMTSSTGTSPATAGCSRSTRPRRASRLPSPVEFGQRAAYTGPQGSTAQQRRGGRREAGRDPLPDHRGRSSPTKG